MSELRFWAPNHTLWLRAALIRSMATQASDSDGDNDAIYTYLRNARDVVLEAQLVSEAVPNVELSAVERAAQQLDGIRRTIWSIKDPLISVESVENMAADVTRLLVYLRESAEKMVSQPVPLPHTVDTGRRGRPAVNINLDDCQRLHDLGNSWASVSEAHGISRQTLYNHFKRSSRSTARQPFSEVTDEDLDELVAQISLEHPFAGQRIVLGHLEAKGIHVPIKRVEGSLRRVDEASVLVR